MDVWKFCVYMRPYECACTSWNAIPACAIEPNSTCCLTVGPTSRRLQSRQDQPDLRNMIPNLTIALDGYLLTVAHAPNLFREQLKARFEIKTQAIGAPKRVGSACAPSQLGGPTDQSVQEGRVLNRVVRWTPDGWEMEPDQRHVDLIVQELGLADARPVSTPGESESRDDEDGKSQLLSESEASKFRGLAARANYLAADRTDLMYSVKEICRAMANPTMGSWLKLKRLGRYLKENGRMTTKYEWQGKETQITGYSDSDWAGCRVTGKSTSGGVIMIGTHFLKGWSRTQNHVTMSSAEAELIALVK